MLKKLTEHVYYMPESDETDRPILGLICGDKYSLVVDSGNSPQHARDFLDEVEKLGVAPVKYLVITHFHWDHVYGIKEMNITTIGHKNTRPRLKEMQQLKWDEGSLKDRLEKGLCNELMVKSMIAEIPDLDNFTIGDLDIAFEGEMEIDLGGISCTLKEIGGEHTDDGVAVHIPCEEVAFLGDCIYGSRFDGVYGYRREPVFDMADRINKLEAKHFIIGHEPVCDEVEMKAFWEELRRGAEVTKNCESLGAAHEVFKEKYEREVNEDELFYIKCFYDVDQVLKKENK